jgi:hypothetical protein
MLIDVDDNLSQIVTSVSDALAYHLQNTPKCAPQTTNQCTTASIKNPFTMSKKQAKDLSSALPSPLTGPDTVSSSLEDILVAPIALGQPCLR